MDFLYVIDLVSVLGECGYRCESERQRQWQTATVQLGMHRQQAHHTNERTNEQGRTDDTVSWLYRIANDIGVKYVFGKSAKFHLVKSPV